MSYNGPLPLILLSSQTASTTSNLDFTTQISTTYSAYFVILNRVVAGTAGANLQMLYNFGSGFVTSNYQNGVLRFPYNSNTATNTNSTSAALLSGPITSGSGVSGYINIFNIASGQSPIMTGNFAHQDNGTSNTTFGEFGGNNTGTGVTQLRFQMSSGTMSSGTISLYGVLE